MTNTPVLIAGGGIAGLAAAVAVARTGRAVRLYEQAAAFAEVGAGLQMSPNGVAALRRLGAWDAVEPSCVTPTEIHVRDGRTGVTLQRIVLGRRFEERFGAPYRVMHRADLLSALLATARHTKNVELATGSQVTMAGNTPDGAMLGFADGRVVEGAAVIAADGIRSAVRPAIAPGGGPVYRGHALFRALIPLDRVPAEIPCDCVTLWLYPGGHVVHYAVSNWRHFNVVAAVNSPPKEGGWSVPGDRRELMRTFSEAADPLASLLAAPQSWLRWAGADIEPLTHWQKRQMTLIGDAAHATLPYLAQGAVMSLEDACVLGNALKAQSTVAAAFAAYARERQPRTARIQRESRALGRIYHARGLTAQARNLALLVLGQDRALNRNTWIYSWQPPPL